MLLRWCFQGLGRWWPTSLRRVPLRHAPGGKAAAVFRPWQSGAVCQWEKQWKTENGIPVWMENWHYCIILNGNTIFTDDLMIKWCLMVFQNPFKETKLIGSDQYIYYIYIYIYYLSKTYMDQLLSDVFYHLQFESNEKNWRCQPTSPKKLRKITILNYQNHITQKNYGNLCFRVLIGKFIGIDPYIATFAMAPWPTWPTWPTRQAPKRGRTSQPFARCVAPSGHSGAGPMGAQWDGVGDIWNLGRVASGYLT